MSKLLRLESAFPERKKYTTTDTQNGRIKHTIASHLKLIGVRFSISSSNILTKVECELPKLLYGHNGRLIKSEYDLDQALLRLNRIIVSVVDDQLLDSVARGEDILQQGWFNRVDLVWQYHLHVHTIKSVLEHARHPLIHAPPDIYGNGNITFKGKRLRVSIYDKMLQLNKRIRQSLKETKITRIEFQIKSKKYVAERFAGDPEAGLQSLDFAAGYRVYRNLLLGFTELGKHASTDETSIAAFLASEAVQNPSILERYIASQMLHPSHASKVRRGVTVIKLKSFDFCSLAPENDLPPVVDIPDTKAEERLRMLTEVNELFRSSRGPGRS